MYRCQTPLVPRELPHLLQSSQALKPIALAGLWMVLLVVNGWRSLDSFNIHKIARSGHERTLHSTLNCRNCFDTLNAQ
jgi:hypothetical protein